MAHTATHPDSFTETFRSAITRGFARIGTALVSMGESSSRRDRVNALSNLSDHDLIARGLSRADIVRYVYGDILWI